MTDSQTANTNASTNLADVATPDLDTMEFVDMSVLVKSIDALYVALDSATKKGAFGLNDAASVKTALDNVVKASQVFEKAQLYVAKQKQARDTEPTTVVATV